MCGRCRNVGGVVATGLAAIVVGSALATLFSVITATSTVYPGKSCLRKCEGRDSRICSFNFNINLYQTLSRACADCPNNSSHCSLPDCVPGNGVRRLITVADKQMPGPAIHVCEGDEIQVSVRNRLPSAGVSLHWHGLTPSPYMDGAPGLTQALIPPNQAFQYSIQATVPGTHYWHAFSGFQSGDGVFGPLVVRRPKSSEPHAHLYDHDLPEHLIMVHDWLHLPTAEMFTLHHHSGADHYPDDILVNGMGRFSGERSTPESRKAPMAEFTVKEGERYLLRLVSAAFMNCPIVFEVARHVLTVIATDGAPIVPYNATKIVLHPGERWDVVLRADQEPASYWMDFQGLLDCLVNDVTQRAVLRYATRRARAMQPPKQRSQPIDIVYNPGAKLVNPVSGICAGNVACLTSLRSVDPLPATLAAPAADTTLYLAFSLRELDNPDYYHDQLYSIHDESESSRVPSPQINNLTYRALPATLLLSPTPPAEGSLCNADRRPLHCQQDPCECLHLHHLPLGQVVDIVLIDAGGSTNQGQTVHLHGHSFRVLGQGPLPPTPGGGGIQRSHVMTLDDQGRLQRSLDHPIEKDTVMVPHGGYTIVRFKADNPGYWLLHSQLLFHWAGGMAVVLRVGETSDLPSPPSNIPLCTV